MSSSTDEYVASFVFCILNFRELLELSKAFWSLVCPKFLDKNPVKEAFKAQRMLSKK
jgi:hypothetical protein